MKHSREDYNRIQDPEQKIPEDEPVFLMRAQDPLAPEVLDHYAAAYRIKFGDGEMAQTAKEHADRMRQWQWERYCKEKPDM